MKKNRMQTRLLEAVLLVILAGSLVPGCLHYEEKPMDAGGFVIDYVAPWGTSLAETSR